MDPSVITAVIAAVLAVIGLATSAVLTPAFRKIQDAILNPYVERIERLLRRGLAPKNEPPINDKLERVASLSSELSQLNSEISDELRRSLSETARLKEEAEIARDLASLNEGQRKAVVSVLNQGEGRNRIFQVVVAFIFFALGIIAGAFVPGWVNALFPPA